MAALKKIVSSVFDFVGDFKEDPPASLLLFFLMVIATAWWIVFVFPVYIPLLALKDWSNHEKKSLWQAYKDNFRGPIQ